jgi:hypothetical protein
LRSPPSACSRCSSARRCACGRPDHQATLHFFWLTVAFFGAMAFSFTGQARRARLDVLLGRPDGAAAAAAALRHFALVFPDRPDAWVRSDTGRSLVNAFYLPALLLGGVQVAGVINGARHGEVLTRVSNYVQVAQLVYLGDHAVAGLAIMVARCAWSAR